MMRICDCLKLMAMTVLLIEPVLAADTEPAHALPEKAASEIQEFGTKNYKVLSSDHVNLVRVAGESISDVVFDTEALEVEADRERGIVFIRVKPIWLAKAKTENKCETAAFFNTKTSSYGITFHIEPVASQTVEIKPTIVASNVKKPETGSEILLSDQVPAPGASNYVQTLKNLLKRSLAEPGERRTEIGSLTADNQSDFEALTFNERVRLFFGLRLRETKAYHAPGYLIELIDITNLSGKSQTVPLETMAKSTRQTLCVGAFREQLRPGETTRAVLIRHAPGQGTVRLILDTLEEHR